MIALDSIVKLDTSVIYIAGGVNPSQGMQGLSLGVDSGLVEILGAPEVRNSPDGLILSSMLSQCIVTTNPNRLVFRDASGDKPSRPDFPGRVAQATGYISVTSKTPYTGFGINFGIEADSVDGELPSKAIFRRIMKEDTLRGTKYDVMGSAIGLWYSAHGRVYDLRIEPRIEYGGNQYEGRKYFARLNVQMALESEIPSAEWIAQTLNDEYDDFIRVLTEILQPTERTS